MKYTYLRKHGLFIKKKSERLSNIRPIEHMTLTYIKTFVMVEDVRATRTKWNERTAPKINRENSE